jgi:hypothetical protein
MFDIILGILKNDTDIENKFEFEDNEEKIICVFRIENEKLKDMNNDIYHEEGFEEYQTEKNKILSEELIQILENASSKQNKRIYNVEKFFIDIKSHIDSEFKAQENTKLAQNINEIDKFYQQYQANAKGCQHVCKFCKKKCDHSGLEEHTHHANDLGHQPRVFSGGYIEKNGKKYASKIICDLVDEHREIKVNGEIKKWSEIMRVGNMGWTIDSGKDMDQFKDQLDYYENLWKVHGKSICEHFKLEDDNTNFREFITQYNENKVDESIHYVIAVDKSGSMSFKNNFNNAMEGLKKFIDHLKENVNPDKCFITFMLFNHKCQLIHESVPLNEFPELNIVRPTGGTNFSRVLNQSINSIRNHQNKAELTRIIVYTDGMASYPEAPIKNIRKMIFEEGMNLKLHWISEANVNTTDKDNVFNKCITFLNSKNCTLDVEVKATNTCAKFIEIFNLDK